MVRRIKIVDIENAFSKHVLDDAITCKRGSDLASHTLTKLHHMSVCNLCNIHGVKIY